MSQTVTQNQCIESKTGWVHQVHSLPNLRAQAVSQPCGQLCHSPMTSRVTAWPDHVAGPSGRVVACCAPCTAVSWPISRHNAQPCLLLPCNDTINCIVTRPASSQLLVTIHYYVLRYNPPLANLPLLARYNGCIMTLILRLPLSIVTIH